VRPPRGARPWDNPDLMRALATLLLLAAAAVAGGKDSFEDETHPRSPGTPLEVVFTPYYCPLCIDEERIQGEKHSVQMMRMPVEDLAKELECGKDWLVIETPHFKILSTLKGSKVKFKDCRFVRADLERLKTIFPKIVIGRDGSLLDAHERAHLYHIRVERIYSHFAALTDCKKPYLGMEGPYQLFLFDDYSQHHLLNDKFIGRANDKAGVQHHMKEKPNYMMFTTSEAQVSRDKGKGDTLFANHVIHNVAHNLVDGYGNYYRETWGWLEEGVGHYYERRENPKFNTFCWSEGRPPAAFIKEDWDSVIYGIVRRGRDDPLANWCEKLQPGQLTGEQNGMSWSIVKWLIETEPIRFTKLLDQQNDYEHKPDCATCIENTFGVSPTVLHNRWRDWVRESYAK